MTHPPSITMPTRGGLANKNWKYTGGSTAMALHGRMAKYRKMVKAERPLVK